MNQPVESAITKGYHPDFDRYMDQKISEMKKSISWANFFDQLINASQIILNVIILVLAAITIWWAVEIKFIKTPHLKFLVPYQGKLDNEGFAYTIFVALFMLLLLGFSIFISGYKTAMKWNEYRKIVSELQYLAILDQTNHWSESELDEHLKNLETKYLNAKDQINWKSIMVKAIKGDRGAK